MVFPPAVSLASMRLLLLITFGPQRPGGSRRKVHNPLRRVRAQFVSYRHSSGIVIPIGSTLKFVSGARCLGVRRAGERRQGESSVARPEDSDRARSEGPLAFGVHLQDVASADDPLA